MTIGPFCTGDIAPFLELATAENWVAESWEFEFLLATFPQGCLAARDDNGKCTGFVTSLRHGNSGWIGNLIVVPEYRGQGIGEQLFLGARESLRSAGVETFWLTASTSGRSLYEKHGFNSIDTIVRWVGTGRQRRLAQSPGDCSASPSLHDTDRHTWGDRRNELLAATIGRGRLLHNESGFLVIQPCGNSVQFGPFSSRECSSAVNLFDAAIQSVAPGTRFLVDAPASNRSAFRLFNRRKMHVVGSTTLMVAGRRPAYRADYLYGLATMGSCG